MVCDEIKFSIRWFYVLNVSVHNLIFCFNFILLCCLFLPLYILFIFEIFVYLSWINKQIQYIWSILFCGLYVWEKKKSNIVNKRRKIKSLWSLISTLCDIDSSSFWLYTNFLNIILRREELDNFVQLIKFVVKYI